MCLSEESHKNQYTCQKYYAPAARPSCALCEHVDSNKSAARPGKQAFPSPITHEMLLAVQMSYFEKKSRKCACPKCPVLKSSYCNIEYMPDGNAKPVDGVCPCCRNADNHGQSIDDEHTEDERAQEECPTVQPYLQILHDEERSIEASKSEAEDTAVALKDCHVGSSGRGTGRLTSAAVALVLCVSTGFSVSLTGPCSGGSRGPRLIDPNHMRLGRGVFIASLPARQPVQRFGQVCLS